MIEFALWIAVGALVGWLASSLRVFSHSPDTKWLVVLFSVIGAISGGFVMTASNSSLAGYADTEITGIILAVIGAILTLFMYKSFTLR